MQVILDDTSHIKGELFSFSAMYQHSQHGTMTACAASTDPDTMYFRQAMKEPNSQDFIDAVKKEFGDLLNDGVFHFVKCMSDT